MHKFLNQAALKMVLLVFFLSSCALYPASNGRPSRDLIIATVNRFFGKRVAYEKDADELRNLSVEFVGKDAKGVKSELAERQKVFGGKVDIENGENDIRIIFYIEYQAYGKNMRLLYIYYFTISDGKIANSGIYTSTQNSSP